MRLRKVIFGLREVTWEPGRWLGAITRSIEASEKSLGPEGGLFWASGRLFGDLGNDHPEAQGNLLIDSSDIWDPQ